MHDGLVERILQKYGVSYDRVFDVQKGYRNESYPVMITEGGMANLVLYKSEPGMLERVRRSNGVSNFLHTGGFPARHTIDDRLIRLTGSERVKYASLYAYLPGSTIPWEAYTQQHLKAIGKTMSDMHACLQNYEVASDLPSVAIEYKRIFRRMLRYFDDPTIRAALRMKLSIEIDPAVMHNCIRILQASDSLPCQQALHMDFVRGNILFATDKASTSAEISGILDFEKTAYGHPIFDVARTLAFLLVDCKYKPQDKVLKYFLQSGYIKRGASSFRSVTIKGRSNAASLLDELVVIFLVHDFYKFLRHNPYEHLPLNEHFVRTRDILFERNIVQTVT